MLLRVGVNGRQRVCVPTDAFWGCC